MGFVLIEELYIVFPERQPFLDNVKNLDILEKQETLILVVQTSVVSQNNMEKKIWKLGYLLYGFYLVLQLVLLVHKQVTVAYVSF